MNIGKFLYASLFLVCVNSQSFNPTDLEKFLLQYRQFRYSGAKYLGRNSENVANMKRARELNVSRASLKIMILLTIKTNT